MVFALVSAQGLTSSSVSSLLESRGGYVIKFIKHRLLGSNSGHVCGSISDFSRLILVPVCDRSYFIGREFIVRQFRLSRVSIVCSVDCRFGSNVQVFGDSRSNEMLTGVAW